MVIFVGKNLNMIEILNQHRTIRKYTDQKIPQELLTKLLETSCRASNTGNMQAYSIVVTTNEEIKKNFLRHISTNLWLLRLR